MKGWQVLKTNSFLLFILILLLASCGNKEEKVELTVSAAASLQGALTEIKEDFESDNPNIKILYNFGGSGALQQQISQGAPVDLFFSAAEDKFELLLNEGLINKEDSKSLVGNELVLIIPANAKSPINSLEDLLHVRLDKFAIGTPESVPAGKYAKSALKKEGVWNTVSEKLIYAKDVRQVLAYVETGNVEAGIVYRTDALSSDKVKIASVIAEQSYEPIVYPVGIIAESKHPNEAASYFQYLQSEKVLVLLEQYGFKRIE